MPSADVSTIEEQNEDEVEDDTTSICLVTSALDRVNKLTKINCIF